MYNSKFTVVIFVALLLVCSGCGTKIVKHGYVFDKSYDNSTLRLGDSMDAVVRKIGEPSFKSADGLGFYYVSYDVKRTSPLGRRLVSSNTVELIFNKDKILTKKNAIDQKDMPLLNHKYSGIQVTGINDSILRSVLKKNSDTPLKSGSTNADKSSHTSNSK